MAERPSREQVETALGNTDVREHDARSSWTEQVLAAEVRALRGECDDLQGRLDVCRFGGENASVEFGRRGEEIVRLRETLARVEGLVAAWRRKAIEVAAYDVGMHEVERCAEDLEKALKGES